MTTPCGSVGSTNLPGYLPTFIWIISYKVLLVDRFPADADCVGLRCCDGGRKGGGVLELVGEVEIYTSLENQKGC